MRRFAEPLVGQRANPRPLLFRGARLVDPAADTDTPGDLLVVDGRIVAAGPGIAAPEGAEIIECAGAVLAPGLVDMQVHTGEPGLEHIETLASASMADMRTTGRAGGAGRGRCMVVAFYNGGDVPTKRSCRQRG